MSETKQVGAPSADREPVDREASVGISTRGTGESAPDVDEDGRDEVDEEIRLDVIFDILKNQRRRHVLRYLQESETTTLSDLAEYVAALENDKDVQSLTSSERKRVYVGLYQCHLPRMDDAGVIDFDSDRGRIELKETAEHLDPYLDAETDAGRPWPLYNLGATLCGGTLYGISAVLLGPEALPSLLVVPLIIVVLSALAIVEYRAIDAADENSGR